MQWDSMFIWIIIFLLFFKIIHLTLTIASVRKSLISDISFSFWLLHRLITLLSYDSDKHLKCNQHVECLQSCMSYVKIEAKQKNLNEFCLEQQKKSYKLLRGKTDLGNRFQEMFQCERIYLKKFEVV